MSDFVFLHAADVHLDSPLRGLEADPDAPVELIRGATRAAFRNLVDLAIERQVAFVLLAGDLYDGDWEDWRTGHFLVEQAARLCRAGIRLAMIAGNHDAASEITRHLRLPDGARLLSAKRPETLHLDDLGVAIHGRSFPERAVTADLSLDYPAPVPGCFNVGMLHTALTGRPGHDPYAPTTVDALVRRNYDYWALGHVHAREIVLRAPWIVFPGNLQGRHARETGAKGATLVQVRAGRIAAVEHVPLDAVRWQAVAVDVAACGDIDAIARAAGVVLGEALDAAEGRPLAARVTLAGRTALHRQLLSEAEHVRNAVLGEARQLGADLVWIEKVALATRPADAPAQRPDAVGRLAGILDGLLADPPAELSGEYAERLAERLRHVELPADHPLQRDASASAQLLQDARDLLLARLEEEA